MVRNFSRKYKYVIIYANIKYYILATSQKKILRTAALISPNPGRQTKATVGLGCTLSRGAL